MHDQLRMQDGGKILLRLQDTAENEMLHERLKRMRQSDHRIKSIIDERDLGGLILVFLQDEYQRGGLDYVEADNGKPVTTNNGRVLLLDNGNGSIFRADSIRMAIRETLFITKRPVEVTDPVQLAKLKSA